MKYLILQRREEPEVPVLFAGHVSHVDMAEIFRADGFAVLSAGFVRFFGGPSGACETHDRSVSLNLGPRPGDAMFISAFYRVTLGSIGVPLAEPGRWHVGGASAAAPVEKFPATACVYCPGPAEARAGTHCPDCPTRQA